MCIIFICSYTNLAISYAVPLCLVDAHSQLVVPMKVVSPLPINYRRRLASGNQRSLLEHITHSASLLAPPSGDVGGARLLPVY
jgi:hypothetical protein